MPQVTKFVWLWLYVTSTVVQRLERTHVEHLMDKPGVEMTESDKPNSLFLRGSIEALVKAPG